MIKRTPSEWLALFKEQKDSGLSAAAFCKQRNLCPKYFSLRRSQLSGVQPDTKSKPFIKARVQAKPQRNSDSITLRSGPNEISIPISVDPDWLATLVKALA